MFNFYLLPIDIQYHINNLILKLHQLESKQQFNNVLKEIECLWYWVLYGSSLLYKTYENIHILKYKPNSDIIIKFVKLSNNLPYIKPSKIEFVKNDINYIIN